MGQGHALAAALLLAAACTAKKSSKVKATKPPNEYSTKSYLHNMAAWPGGHAIVLFGGEHIKSRKSGKKKYARVNDVWAGVEIKCSGASPLLDGVAVSIPHRSTEPARPRHRREMT